MLDIFFLFSKSRKTCASRIRFVSVLWAQVFFFFPCLPLEHGNKDTNLWSHSSKYVKHYENTAAHLVCPWLTCVPTLTQILYLFNSSFSTALILISNLKSSKTEDTVKERWWPLWIITESIITTVTIVVRKELLRIAHVL